MKASLIVLCALGVTLLMRKRSAAARHWVLSVAIVCAAATPLLEPIVPAWSVRFGSSLPVRQAAPPDAPVDDPVRSPPVSTDSRIRAATPAVQSRTADAAPIDIGKLLASIWMAGVGVSILVLLIGLGRLTWLASRSRRLRGGCWVDVAREISRAYGLTRPVTILQSDHPTLLVTWGLMRPKVILPREAGHWPEDRVRIVLGHELAHIQRGDWLMHMTAELVRSVYWFNPLLWIAGRRLREESEQACDDAVLGLGVEAPEYATHLVDLARATSHQHRNWLPGVPAPAIASSSSLERRVRAMLNARLDRAPLTRSARLLAVLALVSVTIPLAGFGQNAFVTFSGSVVDPAGRIIPGVTLVLSDAQRESKREVRTDRAGRFEFVGVPPGEYLLQAQFIGFRALRENVSLTGRAVQKTIELEVGSLQETITVVAGPGYRASAGGGSTRATPYRRDQPEYDPCSASPVGGCLKPPTKIRDVKPVFPQHLSDAKVGGVVTLEATIGVDGSVTRVQPVDPADPVDPAFTHAASAAVSQWQFTPTQLGGVPIEVNMKVTANFVIR